MGSPASMAARKVVEETWQRPPPNSGTVPVFFIVPAVVWAALGRRYPVANKLLYSQAVRFRQGFLRNCFTERNGHARCRGGKRLQSRKYRCVRIHKSSFL